MATDIAYGTWAFRNVTRSFNFWPVIDSISINDAHPDEQATLSIRVEDVSSGITFDNEDIIRCTFDDGSGPDKLFEGHLKTVTLTDHGMSGPRAYDLEANDYTPLLSDDVIDTQGTRHAESVSDRLDWIMSFHTKGITVVFSDLPAVDAEAQDYLGMSVLDALDSIAQTGELSYYVDFDKGLHIFQTETITAPFDLAAGTASPPTSYPFWEWQHAKASSELGNAVLLVGDKNYGMFTNPTSIAAYGRKEFSLTDDSLRSTASMARAANRALLNEDAPVIEGQGKMVMWGLRSGMTVDISHYLWSEVATGSPYIVTGVTTTGIDPHDADSLAQIRVEFTYADRRRRKMGGHGRGGGDHGDGADGSTMTLTNREMEHLHDPFEADYIDTVQYHNPLLKWISLGIFHNIAYTTCGCPIGLGGWSGRAVEEAWWEYTSGALADNVVGVRFSIAAVSPTLINGPIATLGPYIYGWLDHQPDDVGQGFEVGYVPPQWPTAAAVVDIPRYAINEGGTSYFFIAAGWPSIVETGFFCAQDLVDGAHGPMGAITSGGEGGSGKVRHPVVTAKLRELSGGKGITPWAVGKGVIDGSNREFDLIGWSGAGVPRVQLNGVSLRQGDYTYDGDAGTVTLYLAPDVGDVVTFSYKAST